MTGWNLPPGCNVSDLPGNTPEEQAQETAYEKLCEELEVAKLIDPNTVDEEWYDRLLQFIQKKIGDAILEGYQQGSADQREYEEIMKAEAFAKQWRESQGV